MSELREMALARRSICPCGYAVLLDSIPVGTVYSVDVTSVRGGFTYRCGGCGKTQTDVELVDCSQRSLPGLKPIPYSLFLPEATQ